MAMFKRKAKARKLRDLRELEELLDDPKPILLDFYQVGCAPCQVMDGIVNELAAEFAGSAHIVKVDVGRVPGAAETFKVMSTPTFVLLARPKVKNTKHARKKSRQGKPNAKQAAQRKAQRWRTTGLVKKDQLERLLVSNGARAAAD